MDQKTPNERLRRDIERHKERLEEGNQRIIAYYREDVEPPENYPDLDEPPHLSMMKRGVELIEFAATDLTGEMSVFGSTEYETEILLYGVGIESLLNGIHLKIDTEDFIGYMEDHPGRTPWFGYSKEVVVEDLEGKLSEEQAERAELVLDLAEDHRHNEVHLAFHRHRHYYLERLILEATLKMYDHYAGETIPECASLRAEIEDKQLKGQNSVSADIEFDSNGALNST